MSGTLLWEVLVLLNQWEGMFRQNRSLLQVQRHALGLMLTMGTCQISRVLCTLGLEGRDWSAHYRRFSRSVWRGQDCFIPVIQALGGLCRGAHVDVAGDFTHVRKSGLKIAGVRVMRDPASTLKWKVSLIHAVNYLHLGALVAVAGADGREAARCLPVHFSPAPCLRKPGKKASASEIADYNRSRAQRPAMQAARGAILELRRQLDATGGRDKTLSILLDGAFANRTLLEQPIERTHITCRCRRNARLRLPAQEGGGGRVYAPGVVSPDSLRVDHEDHPHQTMTVRLTNRTVTVRYKQIARVYWPGAALRRPLRLLMISSPHHKKRGTEGQAPCFDSETYHIITTDLQRPASELIQAAFDRWQIEVAHREQKSVFGIGDAQVRNALSVERHAAFAVACHSMLHLAAINLAARGITPSIQLPKWRKRSLRPSMQTLLNVLRSEIHQHPELTAPWDINPSFERTITVAAA
jgi:hypothetical protein